MTFLVIRAPDAANAGSPFRVIEQPMGREVEWVNRFLDREWVRRLAETTLRGYAMDLLHFLRWWAGVNHTDAVNESALNATVLLDYLRFQTGHRPQPAAATVNRRVGVVERALRNEFPDTASPFAPGFHHLCWRRSPLGYGRPRPALSRLHVKEPKRIVMPLSVDEVARFWSSFRTSRDLAIVGLMLLQGLRSKEVITLNCEDVLLSESQICVRGKGNKIRVLPPASDTILLLDRYLRLERPPQCGTALFVSLKGPARGARMTPAGMRSLFRHHRRLSQTTPANPHRFRHTFASDMVRAGISLPALMQLMGHAHISTTMIYVQISPRDVFEQYARAVAQHIRPTLPTLPTPL
jgi:site-specific recombinase XerD